MAFNPGDDVEVLIGNMWVAGTVDSVTSNTCYWVMLDNPPDLTEVGRTHQYVNGTTNYNQKILVDASPNLFPGEEIIRSQ